MKLILKNQASDSYFIHAKLEIYPYVSDNDVSALLYRSHFNNKIIRLRIPVNDVEDDTPAYTLSKLWFKNTHARFSSAWILKRHDYLLLEFDRLPVSIYSVVLVENFVKWNETDFFKKLDRGVAKKVSCKFIQSKHWHEACSHAVYILPKKLTLPICQLRVFLLRVAANQKTVSSFIEHPSLGK